MVLTALPGGARLDTAALIKRFLLSRGASPVEDRRAGDQRFYFHYLGEAGTYNAAVLVDDARGFVLLYGYGPTDHPGSPEVVDYLQRANRGMPMGCFEIDMDRGEIRFRASLALAGLLPTERQMETLVMHSLATLDCYWGGVEAVASGRLSPVEAIAEIEMR